MEETEKNPKWNLRLDIQSSLIQITLNDKYDSKQASFLKSLLLEV